MASILNSVQGSEFKLEQLFGSKTRARLLALFLQHPKDAFFVRELTRKIDAQLNSVRRELKNLLDLGLVVERIDAAPRKGASLAEKKKFYTANADFMLFDDLRSLFKKVQILLKNTLVQEIAKAGDLHYFAFTGRFVDKSEAPTDMLIIGEIPAKALATAVSGFEAELGHEVNYTLMTKEEFTYRQQVTDKFLLSILNGEKIVTVNRLGI